MDISREDLLHILKLELGKQASACRVHLMEMADQMLAGNDDLAEGCRRAGMRCAFFAYTIKNNIGRVKEAPTTEAALKIAFSFCDPERMEVYFGFWWRFRAMRSKFLDSYQRETLDAYLHLRASLYDQVMIPTSRLKSAASSAEALRVHYGPIEAAVDAAYGVWMRDQGL